jgi:hypothetical protein
VLLLLTGLVCAAPPPGAAQILSPGKLAAPHAELEGIRNCTACHELGKRGISPDRCLSCHALIETRIAADRGYHASIQRDCADCHQEHLGPDFDLRRLDETAFQHGETGYALELSHGEVACRECHRAELIADPAVVRTLSEHGALGRTFLGLDQGCAMCHAVSDPHGDQFQDRSCADCHDAGTWTDPTAFRHERARFRLEGLHARVGCAACHAEDRDPVPYRPVAFGSCADCHVDPHAGRMSGACASCHSPAGWGALSSVSLDGRFDHGQTAFPLVGAHAAADCVACHRPGRPPATELIRMRYLPESAGATYPKPEATSCGSCHVDRHSLPGSGDRWTACATCHAEARWAPSAYGVERHGASALPLTGAHAVTPCWACHLDPERGHERFTLGLGATDCASCHALESPHDDLYADRTCEACHVTDAFDVVAFDHAGVDGGAEDTTCASCHRSEDPHAGQFPELGCDACHGTEAFVPVDARFDHGRAAFPLDGAHREVPCASCHVTEQGEQGPFTRYRPIGTDCVDCHGGGS